MLKKINMFLLVSLSLAIFFCTPVFAMHIIEGYLSPVMCIIWGILSLPFVLWGLRSLKKTFDKNPKCIILFALCAAFAFVLSALKIPSVTGSSSHPTGVGLGAVIFGPTAMSAVSLIILMFQALLLAHGGLTTLGANLFSMGIAGPFVSFFVYILLNKLNIKKEISVFFAAFSGCLLTYVVTSFQLALAFPESGDFIALLLRFLAVFAVTQIPLAIVEGLVTVIVFQIVSKYNHSLLDSLLRKKISD